MSDSFSSLKSRNRAEPDLEGGDGDATLVIDEVAEHGIGEELPLAVDNEPEL